MIAEDKDMTTDPDEGEESTSGESTPDAGEESPVNEDSGFVPWEEAKLAQMPVSKLAHRTVVKNRHIESAKPVKIKPLIPPPDMDNPSEAEITPILQDNEIVGVKVACDCGAVHEIMFDFSS